MHFDENVALVESGYRNKGLKPLILTTLNTAIGAARLAGVGEMDQG